MRSSGSVARLHLRPADITCCAKWNNGTPKSRPRAQARTDKVQISSVVTSCLRMNDRFAPKADSKAAIRLLRAEDGGLSYWTSAIFGPDDSICALAEGLFDGNAGSGNRKAASGGTPWDGRRAAVAGSTITFAPTF